MELMKRRKVHADPKGRILGAMIVAARAGDLIGQVSQAPWVRSAMRLFLRMRR